jgi:hypothetical protein
MDSKPDDSGNLVKFWLIHKPRPEAEASRQALEIGRKTPPRRRHTGRGPQRGEIGEERFARSSTERTRFARLTTDIIRAARTRAQQKAPPSATIWAGTARGSNMATVVWPGLRGPNETAQMFAGPPVYILP